MKRILSSVLLAGMLLPLAACGSAESTNNSGNTPVVTAENETVAETTIPTCVRQNIDYKGKTVTAATNEWTTSVWKLSTYFEFGVSEQTGDVLNDALYQRDLAVKEMYNVDFARFTIPKQSATDEMTTAILAGEDAFQFALSNATGVTTMLKAGGMFRDMKDLKTLDLSASWWNQRSVEEFQIYGFQYAATGDLNLWAQAAPITNYVNKQMLEDYHLAAPYQLVRDGKWTLDKMIEMSTATASDLNGNATVDAEQDSFGCAGEAGSLQSFYLATGSRFCERDKDGNITVTVNNPKTIAVVEKFIPFMRNKSVCLFNNDYGKQYSNCFKELFLVNFKANRLLFFSNQLLVALDLRDMETDFGVLPLPKLDENQTEYYNASNNSWTTLVTVPVTNSEPEMTGDILNALGYYSEKYVTPAFIDTTVLNKTMRDRESEEMIELIFDTRVYDLGSLFDWGKCRAILNDLIAGNSTDFASKYASYEPNIQSALKATMDELKKAQK